MSTQSEKLFNLLPALYRIRDAELAQAQHLPQGPLQSLLALVDEQFDIIAEDLEQLYDDQFIETCAPWVIPYIGDLIGYKPVHGIASAIASPRAEVAQTIAFRRRKGTILALEQLARDVTGWGAHAAEMFKLVAATQYMKASRPKSHYSPDLHGSHVRDYMNSGFDPTAHTVDVRRIASGRGRYNIHNVAIFLWSLNAYSLSNVPLTPVDGSSQFFRFSSLGADMPLFTHQLSQGSQIASPAQPANVPDRLTRRVLCGDMTSRSALVFYGEANSLALLIGSQFLNTFQVQVCNLSGDDGSWINVPAPGGPFLAAIDPELGRLAFASPLASGGPQATFYQGFNADMGGGEYPSRDDDFAVKAGDMVLSFSHAAPAGTTLQSMLDSAVNHLAANPGTTHVAVEITDSWTYMVSSKTSSALNIFVPAGATIELRAADDCRPTLLLAGELTVTGGPESTFVLNGLVVAYSPPGVDAPVPGGLVHVPATPANQLGNLAINHCTLVPGLALTTQGSPRFPAYPTLHVELPDVQLAVKKSIVGTLQVQRQCVASIADSIIDANAPTAIAYCAPDGVSAGGSLALEQCTVIGKVRATLFALISNTIVCAALAVPPLHVPLTDDRRQLRAADPSQVPLPAVRRQPPHDPWQAPFWAERRQQGCVRFSYLPPDAIVPRQFQCVPSGEGSLRPMFYSLSYGQPGYAKLLPTTDDRIRKGADDGGEMGAFHFVLAPLREIDLKVRLQEYMPVGMEFGIFYQN